MDENGVGLMVTKGLHVHLGCGVLTVSSGDKCVGILTHEHKVAFLLDVSLPAVDSFELDVWIHENFSQHFSRPFIVSLTGSREKHSKENCLRAGMDGVVPKPVSVDKMRSALSELLRA